MGKWILKNILLDFFFLSLSCLSLTYGFTIMLRPNNLMSGHISSVATVIAGLTGMNEVILFYEGMFIILIGTFMFMGKFENIKILLLSIACPCGLFFLKFCISNL
jgi:hypothetical protein